LGTALGRKLDEASRAARAATLVLGLVLIASIGGILGWKILWVFVDDLLLPPPRLQGWTVRMTILGSSAVAAILAIIGWAVFAIRGRVREKQLRPLQDSPRAQT
jgi:hypothetical protein